MDESADDPPAPYDRGHDSEQWEAGYEVLRPVKRI
jgi:hypothetical protein